MSHEAVVGRKDVEDAPSGDRREPRSAHCSWIRGVHDNLGPAEALGLVEPPGACFPLVPVGGIGAKPQHHPVVGVLLQEGSSDGLGEGRELDQESIRHVDRAHLARFVFPLDAHLIGGCWEAEGSVLLVDNERVLGEHHQPATIGTKNLCQGVGDNMRVAGGLAPGKHKKASSSTVILGGGNVDGENELMVHLEEQYVALPVVRGVSHGFCLPRIRTHSWQDDTCSQGVRVYVVEH